MHFHSWNNLLEGVFIKSKIPCADEPTKTILSLILLDQIDYKTSDAEI